MRSLVGDNFGERKCLDNRGWRSRLLMKEGNFGPESKETMAIKALVLCRAKNTDVAINPGFS